MMSKGLENTLMAIDDDNFGDMRILSASGNYCIEKRAAAMSGIDERKKIVSAHATISAATLKKVSK